MKKKSSHFQSMFSFLFFIKLNTKKEQPHSGEVSCVALFNDNILATGGRDGFVHVYHDYLHTAHPKMFQTSDRSPVTALTFLTKGIILVGTSGGNLDRIKLGDGTSEAIYERKNSTVLSICAIDGGGFVVSTVRELVIFDYLNQIL